MQHDFQRIRQDLEESLSLDKHPVALLIGAGCPVAVRIPDGSGGTRPLIEDIAGLTAAVGSALSADPKFTKLVQQFADDGRAKYTWLTVEIVGEGRTGEPFSRGVYRYPTIGDEVHLVTEEDLTIIYGSASSREHVEVGSLSSARSIPARVDLNKLVTRHSAVVGATGSGKSTTVAGLVSKLSDRQRLPAARILMLDIHGEYASAFTGTGKVFRVNPDASRGELPLFIPYWALNFDELLPLTLGEPDDNARGRVIDWITAAKQEIARSGGYSGLDPSWVSVDTALPFSLKKLWYEFRWEIDATYPRSQDQTRHNAKVEDPGDPETLTAARFTPNDGQNVVQSKSTLSIRKQLDFLASRMRDPRLRFLFSPGPWEPKITGAANADLDSLLANWLGDGAQDSRPVSILDLSGVPASVLTDLVGALLRLLFDALFWGRQLAEGGRERPLLIVMEEAHVYLNESSSPASMAAKRIVKEGRKYGIGAMIVSQRSSEIDPTILSQCGTVFALRMGNQQDRSQVASATTDSLKGLLDLLPTLRTGEAIIVGEAVHLPTRTMIHLLPEGQRPSSDDPRIVEREFASGETGPGGWDRQLENADYSDLVSAWRRQDPSSSRSIKRVSQE